MAATALVLLVLFFSSIKTGWADPVISEFVVRPGANEGEWVEVWNPDSHVVPLDGWAIRDATGNARLLAVEGDLRADAFLVLAARPESLRARYALPDSIDIVRPEGWPVLNDRDASTGSPADVIVLVRADGAAVDSVAYFEAWLPPESGRSLERGSVSLPGVEPGAWGWCVDPSGATPGSVNSLRLDFDSASASEWEGPATVAPSRAPAIFHYRLPGPGTIAIWLLDRAGNEVATLQQPRFVSGLGRWIWSGEQALPPRAGLYYLCLRWQSPGDAPIRRCRSVWVSR